MMFLGWLTKYVKKRDPGEVAREWMNNNKSTVDGWLGL